MKVTGYMLALSLSALVVGFAPKAALADGPKNFLTGYTESHSDSTWSDEDRTTASVSKTSASDENAPAKDDSHESVQDKYLLMHNHRL